MTYCLLNLPMEPIANRYTVDWANWFPEAFQRNKIPFINIAGSGVFHRKGSKTGFNDPFSSFRWKFSQLRECVRFIDSHLSCYDKFIVFMHDAWFPGQECFPYLELTSEKEILLTGFLHAGSYMKTDLLADAESQFCNSERQWLINLDLVFVGSQYHKDIISLTRSFLPCDDFIKVTGCPVSVSVPPLLLPEKEDVVVFPHRLSPDKRPDIFNSLAKEPEFKDVKFIKTLDVCKNKKDYYDLLARAKVAVSCAEHETFGISMVEATMLGCWPVVPSNLSYPEIFHSYYRYNSYDEMKSLVAEGLNRPSLFHNMDRWKQENVTDAICGYIKELVNE